MQAVVRSEMDGEEAVDEQVEGEHEEEEHEETEECEKDGEEDGVDEREPLGDCESEETLSLSGHPRRAGGEDEDDHQPTDQDSDDGENDEEVPPMIEVHDSQEVEGVGCPSSPESSDDGFVTPPPMITGPGWNEEFFSSPIFGNSGPPRHEIVEMCIGLMQFIQEKHPDLAKIFACNFCKTNVCCFMLFLVYVMAS